MKVKKQIEILSKMDPEAEITLHTPEGHPVLFILASEQRKGVVWLETQYDCDIQDEIASRFQYASENNVDELDFYTDLSDTGITADMVEAALGKDVADHMRTFCKEHGLT